MAYLHRNIGVVANEGWDVHVLTKARSRRVIEDFLREFVDVDRAWHRPVDEQLMVLAADRTGQRARSLDDFDWEASRSLGQIVNRALARPWRAFFVSDLPTLDARFGGATIGFTSDGYFLAGLEIEGLDEATSWLGILAELLDAQLGAVTQDAPWFTLAEAESAITAGFPRVRIRWSRGMSEPEVLGTR